MQESLEDIANQLALLLKQQKLTIATAESCTGGWIGKELTAIAGSSAFFRGGVIAYSNEIKHKLLNVPAEIIQKHGAVSQQVVQAMALGAKQRLDVDIAIAVSGIAGPAGGSVEKPVGTVWFAWTLPGNLALQKGKVIAEEKIFTGSREDVRKSTVYHALDKIKQILAD
ncbi:MAG: CinA family protein [Gammaproteobacteria bacterium]|nr:MAG: CinA family protein [Gammaproteobacteria bacterium]